jgi:pyruvate dehydrogenase E2 component (dihydrolipoamide acetyltransferase)
MPLASAAVVCLFLVLPARATPLAGVVWQAQDSQSQTSPENPSPSPAKQDAPAPGQEPNQGAPEPNQGNPQPDQAQPSEAPRQASPNGEEKQNAAPSAQPAKPAPRRSTAAKKKTATKSKTAHSAQKKSSTSSKADNGSKKVVKNGSSAEPAVQLAPSMSAQQASNQRQGTNELLASTDENLKKISGKTLPSNQQDVVQQIRKFMQQSKEATDAGDLDRAHNLALKASLLAQELAKP